MDRWLDRLGELVESGAIGFAALMLAWLLLG